MAGFKYVEIQMAHGGNTRMANGDMALSQVLPDSVNQRRQQVRQRVRSLREPVRSRRERLVPGPDVIGGVERNVMNLRSRLMSRDSILDRIQERRNGGNGGNDSNGDMESKDSGSTGVQFQ